MHKNKTKALYLWERKPLSSFTKPSSVGRSSLRAECDERLDEDGGLGVDVGADDDFGAGEGLVGL